MRTRTSDDIRAEFIEFWQARGSQLQSSSSLIPHNDPTVLLTTAGMQQFVPYFLGRERPPHTPYAAGVGWALPAQEARHELPHPGGSQPDRPNLGWGPA